MFRNYLAYTPRFVQNFVGSLHTSSHDETSEVNFEEEKYNPQSDRHKLYLQQKTNCFTQLGQELYKNDKEQLGLPLAGNILLCALGLYGFTFCLFLTAACFIYHYANGNYDKRERLRDKFINRDKEDLRNIYKQIINQYSDDVAYGRNKNSKDEVIPFGMMKIMITLRGERIEEIIDDISILNLIAALVPYVSTYELIRPLADARLYQENVSLEVRKILADSRHEIYLSPGKESTLELQGLEQVNSVKNLIKHCKGHAIFFAYGKREGNLMVDITKTVVEAGSSLVNSMVRR